MIRQVILIVSFIVFISCNTDVNKVAIKQELSSDIIREQREICDANFDVFFGKFKNDSVFQRNHIKFPLKDSHLDDDYDKVLISQMTYSNYTFIDFNSHKNAMKQEYDKFTVEIKKEGDNVSYLMRSYDNGISTDIKFNFIDGCWFLTEIKDTST